MGVGVCVVGGGESEGRGVSPSSAPPSSIARPAELLYPERKVGSKVEGRGQRVVLGVW